LVLVFAQTTGSPLAHVGIAVDESALCANAGTLAAAHAASMSEKMSLRMEKPFVL
jgi:hypothetical protein